MCDVIFFFFQAEDGILDLVRSRGLGDVYKRQVFQTFDAMAFASVTVVGAGIMLAQADPRLLVPLVVWFVLYAALVRWTVRYAGPAAKASSDARSAGTGHPSWTSPPDQHRARPPSLIPTRRTQPPTHAEVSKSHQLLTH